MTLAKCLQAATTTTKLTHSIRLVPWFARSSLKMRLASLAADEINSLKLSKGQMESMVVEMRNHMKEMQNKIESSDDKTSDLIKRMQKGEMDQNQIETEMKALLRLRTTLTSSERWRRASSAWPVWESSPALATG